VTLRDGRWLFLIVPALAILAALQQSDAMVCIFSCSSGRSVAEDIAQAFWGTIVGAMVAAFVRFRKRKVTTNDAS